MTMESESAALDRKFAGTMGGVYCIFDLNMISKRHCGKCKVIKKTGEVRPKCSTCSDIMQTGRGRIFVRAGKAIGGVGAAGTNRPAVSKRVREHLLHLEKEHWGIGESTVVYAAVLRRSYGDCDGYGAGGRAAQHEIISKAEDILKALVADEDEDASTLWTRFQAAFSHGDWRAIQFPALPYSGAFGNVWHRGRNTR
jgi:hypothetical protein